jgi:predicted aminopeptidase
MMSKAGWENIHMRIARRRPAVRALRCFALMLLACAAGCGVDFAYLIPAATGQLDIITRAVPIEQALAGGQLSAEQERKLRLVANAREFARDTIGLTVGNQYSTFYNSGGEPIAFNVSASRRDRFEPFYWSFPFVGNLPFLGYFDWDAAQTERDRLIALGYDVFIYEIDAYFAGGFIPNPILSPMLNRPDASLIDTVIHELVHATISRPNDTPFNESLATFVGRTGAVQFLDTFYANQPARREAALASFADNDRYSAFALSLVEELEVFFASDLSAEAKVVGRDAIYHAAGARFGAEILPQMHVPENYAWAADHPVNNALLLGVRRYNLDLAVFSRVFEALDRDWAASLAVFRAAAQAPDAYAYLRAWPDVERAARQVAPAPDASFTSTTAPSASPCPRCRATTWVPTD